MSKAVAAGSGLNDLVNFMAHELRGQHPMEVRISRTDKIPAVCVVCGAPANQTVELTYTPRRRSTVWVWVIASGITLRSAVNTIVGGFNYIGPNSIEHKPAEVAFDMGVLLIFGFAGMATIAVLFKIFNRLYPTIQRTLPFCEKDSVRITREERRRVWKLISAVLFFYVGVGVLFSAELVWPLLVSTAIALTLIILTEDFILAPREANERAVALARVHPHFVEEFDQLNRVTAFDVAGSSPFGGTNT